MKLSQNLDCGFVRNKNWFRYRVAAIIIENGCVLMASNDAADYYYSVGGAVCLGETTEEAIVRELFEESGEYEIKNQKVKIKYLSNHYYLPIIASENEKIDYIKHIINVKSEVDFIEQLEEYLIKPNNIFSQFDWWMFSKLDQTLDEVKIPYYSPQRNHIAGFYPDFIFWMQKDERYLILFVDPKGTEHADAYRKIDGYSRIFENVFPKKCKGFSYNDITVNVKLLLKTKSGIASVPENYRKYWFDNFDDFAKKITQI